MPQHLNLNAYRIHVPDTVVSAERLTFESGDALKELRSNNVGSHVCVRRGGNIIAVPVVAGAPELGGEPTQISLLEDLGLSAWLWREAFLRHLRRLDRPIVNWRPVRFISMSNGDDLLRSILDGKSKRIDSLRAWMYCRVRWSVDTRILRPSDGRPSLVAIASATSRREFQAPLSEMLAAGLNPNGLWVGTRIQSWDARLQPTLRLAGRVRRVDGDHVAIDDGVNVQTRAANELFLAADSSAVETALRWASDRRAWMKWSRKLREAPKHVTEGGRYLKRLRRFGAHLAKNQLEITPGVSVRVDADLLAVEDELPMSRAKSPTYVFDAAGRKTAQSNSRGLSSYGPYSQGSGISHRPRICIVCQASEQGRVEQFIYKFLNGVPNSVFDRGFSRTYGLEVPQPIPFVTNGDSADDYLRAARKAMEHATSEGFTWDLALVQTWTDTFHLAPERNPYVAAKAFFLGHQVPVQAFRIETTTLSSGQLPYTLSNMGLASYAKLGGIPWVLRADPTVTHELVFGMASTWMKRHRLDSGERLVGITTVFSGDGNYFLYTASRAVAMADYQAAMLDSVSSVFETTRAKMNWQAGDRVRLVFHAFKPMKNAEAAAVMDAVSEIDGLNVDVAFLHVADDIGYELLAPNSDGMRTRNGSRGRRAPSRGQVVELSDHEVLLCTVGPKELKTPEDGLPTPLSLKLHADSSFTDMRYLAQQAFAFSGHSWLGFQPAPMPVTIAYSRKVAALMAKLAQAPQWNPDALYGRIGTTRWFL